MTALNRLLPWELDDLYPVLQENFPPTELKKLPHLHSLIDRGVYDMWKLEENGRTVGLALLLRTPGCRYVLLDYLVMLEKGRGYGSLCLKELKKVYPGGIMLEAEALLEGLPEETLHIRRRRLAFYQRAGWTPFPFRNWVFGEVYLIHLWAEELPEDGSKVCARELYLAYREQVPASEKLKANVFVEGYCKEEEMP